MGETDDENLLDPKEAEQPISRAARAGHLEIVEPLLKHGVDTNYRNAEGGSPLALAIQHGHPDLVRFMLANGADQLLRSVYRGHAEILNVSLEQQALAAAAGRNDRIKIILILLARGTDIDCQANRLRPLDLLPL